MLCRSACRECFLNRKRDTFVDVYENDELRRTFEGNWKEGYCSCGRGKHEMWLKISFPPPAYCEYILEQLMANELWIFNRKKQCKKRTSNMEKVCE